MSRHFGNPGEYVPTFEPEFIDAHIKPTTHLRARRQRLRNRKRADAAFKWSAVAAAVLAILILAAEGLLK